MDGFGFLPIVAAIWAIIVVAKKLSQANDEKNRQQALEQERIRRRHRQRAQRHDEAPTREDEETHSPSAPEDEHDEHPAPMAVTYGSANRRQDPDAAPWREHEAGPGPETAAPPGPETNAPPGSETAAPPGPTAAEDLAPSAEPSHSDLPPPRIPTPEPYEYKTSSIAPSHSSLYSVGDVYTPSSVYTSSYSIYPSSPAGSEPDAADHGDEQESRDPHDDGPDPTPS